MLCGGDLFYRNIFTYNFCHIVYWCIVLCHGKTEDLQEKNDFSKVWLILYSMDFS